MIFLGPGSLIALRAQDKTVGAFKLTYRGVSAKAPSHRSSLQSPIGNK